MISLERAKTLIYGTVLYHVRNRNSDGTPQRWRVNGKPKTWKTRPQCVKIPLKHGLYGYDYLTENDLDLLCEDETDARG
jgi:hypothetical protein